MNSPGNDLLLLAGKIIAILLQGIMAVGAAALAIAVPALLLFGDQIVEGINAGSAVPLGTIPILPLASVMLIAFAILAALFVFFGKLRAIIATVGEGDPFVPANADRLNLMAWLMLGVQILVWPATICAHILAAAVRETDGFLIEVAGGDGFSLTSVLMVLVLFILARVFRQGASMRDDLEGTV